MINSLNVATIMVLDKDEALDFYVNKLGLGRAGLQAGSDYRWLTVRVPGEHGTEISLEQPGSPLHDDATAAQIRELITKGAMSGSSSRPTTPGRSTRPSRRAASPTSPRSRPTTSTAPTWASATLRQRHPDPPAGEGRPGGDRLTVGRRWDVPSAGPSVGPTSECT